MMHVYSAFSQYHPAQYTQQC